MLAARVAVTVLLWLTSGAVGLTDNELLEYIRANTGNTRTAVVDGFADGNDWLEDIKEGLDTVYSELHYGLTDGVMGGTPYLQKIDSTLKDIEGELGVGRLEDIEAAVESSADTLVLIDVALNLLGPLAVTRNGYLEDIYYEDMAINTSIDSVRSAVTGLGGGIANVEAQLSTVNENLSSGLFDAQEGDTARLAQLVALAGFRNSQLGGVQQRLDTGNASLAEVKLGVDGVKAYLADIEEYLEFGEGTGWLELITVALEQGVMSYLYSITSNTNELEGKLDVLHSDLEGIAGWMPQFWEQLTYISGVTGTGDAVSVPVGGGEPILAGELPSVEPPLGKPVYDALPGSMNAKKSEIEWDGAGEWSLDDVGSGPEEVPPEWEVTIPVGAFGSVFGWSGSDIDIDVDLTWYDEHFRVLVRDLVMAVFVFCMALRVWEEFRKA